MGVTVTLTTSSVSPWTVPADYDVLTSTIVCVGSDTGTTTTRSNIWFNAGASISFAVGASGTGNPSWIGGNSLATAAVGAAGGGGPSTNGSITITYTSIIKTFEVGMGSTFLRTQVVAY